MYIWKKQSAFSAILPWGDQAKVQLDRFCFYMQQRKKTKNQKKRICVCLCVWVCMCVGMLGSDNQFQPPKVGRYHFITAEEGAGALAEIMAD